MTDLKIAWRRTCCFRYNSEKHAERLEYFINRNQVFVVLALINHNCRRLRNESNHPRHQLCDAMLKRRVACGGCRNQCLGAMGRCDTYLFKR